MKKKKVNVYICTFMSLFFYIAIYKYLCLNICIAYQISGLEQVNITLTKMAIDIKMAQSMAINCNATCNKWFHLISGALNQLNQQWPSSEKILSKYPPYFFKSYAVIRDTGKAKIPKIIAAPGMFYMCINTYIHTYIYPYIIHTHIHTYIYSN